VEDYLPPVRRPEQMSADRIGALVRDSAPSTLCFPCIAVMLDMSEHAAREGSVRLIVSRACQLVRQVCSACHRLDEVLVVGQARQGRSVDAEDGAPA
jgi:hypothetical protein